MREQQKDKELLKRAKNADDVILRSFHGGGKVRQLLCDTNQKIIVPRKMQKRVVEWYHELLCHPGQNRTELTIAQHLTWKGLRKTVESVCAKCDLCQRTKRTKKSYGHLPPKEAEIVPWYTLCVDMIGPYKISRKGKKDLQLWAVTMIDPATGWFEMTSVETKRADVVANAIEQAWLTRYPWPTQMVLDRGTEFMAEFSEMVEQDYGVKKKPITKRNPQANAIVERVHQTIGNMIRSFQMGSNEEVDEEDPWSGILSAVAFAVRATVHSTTRATPMQLVFGRDAIFNVQHIADWQFVKERKQRLIDLNNKRENAKRLPYTYVVGQRVLVKAAQSTKYGTDAYLGPFTVDSVNPDNGTVRVNEGAVTDTYNIRNVTPYHS